MLNTNIIQYLDDPLVILHYWTCLRKVNQNGCTLTFFGFSQRPIGPCSGNSQPRWAADVGWFEARTQQGPDDGWYLIVEIGLKCSTLFHYGRVWKWLKIIMIVMIPRDLEVHYFQTNHDKAICRLSVVVQFDLVQCVSVLVINRCSQSQHSNRVQSNPIVCSRKQVRM